MKTRLNKEFKSNKGLNFKIVEYTNSTNCTVQFEDGTIIRNVQYGNIIAGTIKNPNTPTICGVGFIGQGNYVSYANKKFTKSYQVWVSMIKRCYCNSQNRDPSYEICLVDERWHNFQVFAKWHECNYREDFHLDKDILIKGNKVYSPKTCCFIPQEINTVFTKRDSKRGDLPIGVFQEKGGRYRATVGNKGERVYLGIFDTPELAFQTYKVAKEEYIKEVADKWKPFIHSKVYAVMYRYKVEITD